MSNPDDTPPAGTPERERERVYEEIFRRKFLEKGEQGERGGTGVQSDGTREAARNVFENLPLHPIEISNRCIDRYRDHATQHPICWEKDTPSEMRTHIQELMQIDATLALGAVLQTVQEESRALQRSQHGEDVVGCTYDLVAALFEMCQGGGEAGKARVAALMRYIFDTRYSEDTKAAEFVCSDREQSYKKVDGKEEKWKLTLNDTDLVIDLGCGPGNSMDVFRKKTNNVFGIDINPRCALNDDAIRVGIIDTHQQRLDELDMGQISFQQHFDSADVVFASLVMDRVASHNGLLLNCKELLKPKGIVIIPTLLPVNPFDDEPGLEQGQRIKYVVEQITAGQTADADFFLISESLKALGFVDVKMRQLPISDPATGRTYDNHYIIVAHKGA